MLVVLGIMSLQIVYLSTVQCHPYFRRMSPDKVIELSVLKRPEHRRLICITRFLGEFLLSAAFISALPFSGTMASTGMIIWALIGLVGMLTGLVTVGAVRRRSRLDEPTGSAAPVETAPQTTAVAHAEPVPQSNLTQAA